MISLYLTASILIIAAVAATALPPVRLFLLRRFPKLDNLRFDAAVELTSQQDGEDIDVFSISMCGRIICPKANCDTDIRITLFDATENTDGPLAVFSAAGRNAQNPAFCLQVHNGAIPSRNAILARRIPVAHIPVSMLSFPRRGQRMLLFVVCVIDTATGKTLVSSKVPFGYFVSVPEGYLDFRDRIHNVFSASLALASSVSDFTLDSMQRSILEQWLQKKGVSMRLSDCMPSRSAAPADPGNNQTKTACEVLCRQSDNAHRQSVVELCLMVAAAKPPVSPQTLEFLESVAATLDIPKPRFQSLCQKILSVELLEIPDPKLLLGIEDTMSEQAAMVRLTDEYRKWNARVNHPDEKVRDQADRMLNFIAATRSKLQSLQGAQAANPTA